MATGFALPSNSRPWFRPISDAASADPVAAASCQSGSLLVERRHHVEAGGDRAGPIAARTPKVMPTTTVASSPDHGNE
jgi:hypothetical protein